jgi:hypothetical protein
MHMFSEIGSVVPDKTEPQTRPCLDRQANVQVPTDKQRRPQRPGPRQRLVVLGRILEAMCMADFVASVIPTRSQVGHAHVFRKLGLWSQTRPNPRLGHNPSSVRVLCYLCRQATVPATSRSGTSNVDSNVHVRDKQRRQQRPSPGQATTWLSPSREERGDKPSSRPWLGTSPENRPRGALRPTDLETRAPTDIETVVDLVSQNPNPKPFMHMVFRNALMHMCLLTSLKPVTEILGPIESETGGGCQLPSPGPCIPGPRTDKVLVADGVLVAEPMMSKRSGPMTRSR